jgi:hypothetical protein
LHDITNELDHFADGGLLDLATIAHDLTPVLCLWHGGFLNIADCPRFDDALLDAMSSKENGVFNCTAYVEYLKIGNCPSFSIAALRRFVDSRLDLPADNDDPWNSVTPRIRNIHLYGNVPSMSEEEQAWFDANLQD